MIVLENKMCLGGDPVLQHDAVHSPGFVTSCGGLAIGAADIGRTRHVVAGPGNAPYPSPVTQLLIECPVPSASGAPGSNPADNRPVPADLVVTQCAGVGERFTVLHCISMGVKEIVWSWNRLVTDGCIKMAELDIQAIPDRYVSFCIRLRKRNAIVSRRRTTQVEIPVTSVQRLTSIYIECRNAVCLSKNSIRTKHEIETPAKIPRTALGHDGALYKYIELIQLKSI